MALDALSTQSAYAFFMGSRGAAAMPAGVQPAGMFTQPMATTYGTQQPGVFGTDAYGQANAALSQRLAQMQQAFANAGQQVNGALQNAYADAQASLASFQPSYPQMPAMPMAPAYQPAPPGYMPTSSYQGQANFNAALQNASYQMQNVGYQMQNAMNGLVQNVNQMAQAFRGQQPYGYQRRF